MLQEIIVYIILIFAFGITIYKSLGFFNVFGHKKDNASVCGSCSSGACGSCSLKTNITYGKPVMPLKIDHQK